MKIVKAKIGFLILLGIMLLVIGASYKPASAVSTYACLPTCNASDARFLALAGSGLSTFAGDTVAIEIAASAGSASVDVDIFDGDTSGTWDSGTTASMFELFADPAADGTGTTSVGSWSGGLMTDNGWYSISVPTSGAALAPSGNFFYTLRISNPAPGDVSLNSFKVRTTAGVVTMKPQAFAFVAPAIKMADINIVYPSWPSLSPTTYDGTWDFHLAAVPSTGEFVAWDGDLDFGAYNYSTMDTDDPDTPNVVPPWGVGTEAVPEGVAAGFNGTTGAPSDDSSFAPYRRSPSVVYSITDPNGNVFTNSNPSGNQEWEQFLITDDGSKDADYYVGGPMPSGVYHVQMTGMDMTNLNAWRFDYDLLCVTDTGEICGQLFPYLLGDTVFYDTNGNGVQDLGEPGIGGVTVNLVDEFGTVLATTTTDGNGYYDFGVYPGTYTVQVDGSNFGSGAPLEDLSSTTGGETQTNTVVDANVMTYDFGYRAEPTNPGTGTPGYWKNHPEAWPVDGLYIGDQFFTKEQAIDIMNAKGGGDMRYVMFNHLVAAKLNVLIGNDDSCVADAIAAADQWFIDVGLDFNVQIKTDSDAWAVGEPILETLDAYNNGLLCAPSRG